MQVDILPARHENIIHKAFLFDALRGLSRTPKSLPCKYFYNKRGSELFELICRLDEYYLTRKETAILEIAKGEIAELIGDSATIIEPGSGAGKKIQILFSALKDIKAYIPIDISKDILARSSQEILRIYPGVKVLPLVRDFTKVFTLPGKISGETGKKIIFFPGSTIGNFYPNEVQKLLYGFSRIAGMNGGLLIGFDLLKDVRVLEAAYNDKAGVTEAFNKNLLVRMNEELGANINLDNFMHSVRFNPFASRIEMRLVSIREQEVSIWNRKFRFQKFEAIHTENSYKYTVENFHKIASSAGINPVKTWVDQNNYYAITYFAVKDLLY